MLKGTAYGVTEWDYAGVTLEPLPAVDDDIDPLFWWVDTDTGDIYNLEPSPDDAPSEWVNKGPIAPAQVPPGYPGDNADPPAVVGFAATSTYQQQADGTDLPVISGTWTLTGAPADVIGYELQWDAGTLTQPGSGDPVYEPADWANALSARVGSDQTSAILSPVLGGKRYDVRMRAYDSEGRVGPWVTVSEVVVVGDVTPPATPLVNAVGGYRMVAAYWPANSEPDLSHYEIQHRLSGATEWPADPIEARATRIVITDLSPGVYEVEVRAVDHSGNVSAWSITATAEATLVGQEDVAFDEVVANFMTTGTLQADQIVGGTLSVGGPDDDEVAIRVYDSVGQPIGAWGDFGWLVADPTVSPSRAIWATPQGEMKFSGAYDWDGSDPIEAGLLTTVWTTAIGPDGINAEAIKFGSAGGGSNRILNAGVELQAYPTVALVSVTWTDPGTGANQWGTVLAGSINLDVSAADLKMSAV